MQHHSGYKMDTVHCHQCDTFSCVPALYRLSIQIFRKFHSNAVVVAVASAAGFGYFASAKRLTVFYQPY